MVQIRPGQKNDLFHPQQVWPADCFVQWGGDGVVISNDSARTTAFFEAFPEGLGFIRGEGATVKEAEEAAFTKYLRQSACPGHEWSRRHYTNGYAFCRHCGCGKSAMKPIVKLGDWRAPLSSFELQNIIDGGLLAWEDRRGKYYPPSDRTRLRARLFGIHLPPIPREPVDILETETHPYTLACQDVVFGMMRDLGGPEGLEGSVQDKDKTGMMGIFSGLSRAVISSAYKEWLERQDASEEVPDGP